MCAFSKTALSAQNCIKKYAKIKKKKCSCSDKLNLTLAVSGVGDASAEPFLSGYTYMIKAETMVTLFSLGI